MKILNIVLFISHLAYTLTDDFYCRLTSQQEDTSQSKTIKVLEILKGIEEAAESYNQTLQNLQVKQTITLKSTLFG